MSTVVENTKVLVVDTSPAMLEVLKNFSNKHGYDMDSHSDPADAAAALNGRFQQFGVDYRCVMLGWPQGNPAIIRELLTALSLPDHQDLPLLIVCQEETPELAALRKRRAKTHSLLWKDYQNASEIIDRLPVVRVAPQQAQSNKNTGPKAVSAALRKQALLVDSAPSICHTLREMMEANGYQITVASTAGNAHESLESSGYDLIVADYHLLCDGRSDERGIELFCEAARLNSSAAVIAVVSAKYTDAVIKHSLAAGAATCLFKSESTELLFARIDALTKNLVSRTQVSKAPANDNKALANNTKVQSRVVPVKAVPVKATVVQGKQTVNNKAMKKTADIVDAIASSPATVSKHQSAAKTPQFAPAKPVEQEVPANHEKASAPAVQAVDKNAVEQQPEQAKAPVERSGKPIDKEKFAASLDGILRNFADKTHGNVRYSVLMLDVQLVAATGDRLSIGDSEPMRNIVLQRLSRLYKRENSLSYLGEGQFAFILVNRRVPDALMLTSKVLEVVPKMVRYLNNMALVSHAAVVQIDGSCVESAALLTQCRAACARTRKDQRDNCALVMPMRKYLTALESEETA